MTNTTKKHSALREILNTGLYLLLIFVLTWLFITYVGQRTQVVGSSMYDTLEDGDNLIVNKLGYRLHDPERFDIVVFPCEGEFFIKRIIGLPGESVRIDKEGKIYINEVLLDENYGYETIEDPGRAIETLVLGEDEYFVLGDNRNNSRDSRDPMVGNITRDRIVGKAFIRIYPFDKFGVLKHQ
jgi:signal peptidase I